MEWEDRVTKNLICVDTDDTQSIIFPEFQQLSLVVVGLQTNMSKVFLPEEFRLEVGIIREMCSGHERGNRQV